MSLAERILSHNINFSQAEAAVIKAAEEAKALYAEETIRVIGNIKEILEALNAVKGFKEIKVVHANRTIRFGHSPVESYGICAFDSDDRYVSQQVADFVNDGPIRDFFSQPKPAEIVERALLIQPWFLASH